MLGDLAHPRRPAHLLAQQGDHATELEMELLDAPRHSHRPALIAEVPLQLPDDRGRGERRELQAAFGIEPLDRLQQAEQGDLYEVLVRLPAVGEAPGEELRERDMVLDQLVPQAPVAGAPVLAETLVEPGGVDCLVTQLHRDERSMMSRNRTSGGLSMISKKSLTEC